MKTLSFKLSLMGLMLGLCTLSMNSLAADKKAANTAAEDKEVRELVESVVTKPSGETIATRTTKEFSNTTSASASGVASDSAKAGTDSLAIPAGDENAPIFKNATQTDKKEKAQSGFWLWARMLGSLALVVLLIVGGTYFLKKSPVANKLNRQAKMIQVLGTHHMGAKKSLAVIRVAGETVLIGLTDHNISILKSLSLLDDDLPGDPATKNKKFSNTLSQKIQPEEEFSMSGIKDIVSNRLKNMKELGR